MVFEEEDFQPVMYGYRLVPDVTETRALGMLREVEDELGKKMKASKAIILSQEQKDQNLVSQVIKKNIIVEVFLTEIFAWFQHEENLALYSRIKFTRTLYLALSAMEKRDQTMEQGRYLGGCSELLLVLQKTVNRGIQPDPPSDNTSSNRGKLVLVKSFKN